MIANKLQASMRDQGPLEQGTQGWEYYQTCMTLSIREPFC